MNESQDNRSSQKVEMGKRQSSYADQIAQLSIEKVEKLDRLKWIDEELLCLRGALAESRAACKNLDTAEAISQAKYEKVLAERDPIPPGEPDVVDLTKG